jgi:hypothetical protein
MLATMLPSHAGDDVAGLTWPRHDEDAESCWRRCCRVVLVTTLLSPVGDGATESCAEDAESCY